MGDTEEDAEWDMEGGLAVGVGVEVMVCEADPVGVEVGLDE